ncbi:L,D-transpeptidase family protein [Streptomyces sp. H10-C2]|uniref:L,D-transpeptidase family protein n=1 Tax=unclassified Streptomyces TaxID=2593676 RepID=UPI0024BA01FA|nr:MULTISPECIES: L,D-transpeptidase family protein [unclassified Streptomyces]MDJ0344078.1 L,D-transpeptidase family protein [Streptomyces sp. PH10-H1]MDJ0368617.1 L,D-transpeptidase family protein [Streptomyces sp. H10-C2]
MARTHPTGTGLVSPGSRSRRHADARSPRAARTAAAGAVTAWAVAGILLGSGPAQGATPPPVPAPHFPVPVMVGTAGQVISVQARGTYATVIAWQKTGAIWVKRYTTTAARVGSHGITDGATRKQGTYTTPTGTYTVSQGFGVAANPGTKMPYHQVTAADWWVEDPDSAYYNRMRRAEQGGFPLTEKGDHGSERLVNYPVQYRNALVIDFNNRPAVKGRGAGMFLHALGPAAGPTAGCVALPQAVLTSVMRWIDPAQHPVIAVG